VTNGFEEIQNVKLTSGNLHRFFNHIVTSQKAGHKKPSEKIFEFALSLNSAECCDVVMIGDNLVTDMGGARAARIDTIFLNRDKITYTDKVNYEISCLSELTNIL
jgi:putative hydrolase of the HAD superfamily